MCIDLVYKPYSLEHGGLFLWMDNFGGHKTAAVTDIFNESRVNFDFLPPNMTYLLQVLDLVVNGPVKAHIRNLRGFRLLRYLDEFKAKYDAELAKPKTARICPQWIPPKPSLHECLLDLLDLFKDGGAFCTPKFVEGIKSSFIKTGTGPKLDGTFTQYSAVADKGTMLIAPAGTVHSNEFKKFVDSLADNSDGESSDDEDDDDEDELTDSGI